MPEDRRLAAIMFTDIIGYTILMESGQDKAFDILQRNHAIHEKPIKQFNGTLIKEIGDGTMASFSIASDAVRWAMEIQKSCKEQKIQLKIGIHEGEMVFTGADVLGDGVMDEILMHLYKIGDLRVISRTSVMGYKGTTTKMKSIREEYKRFYEGVDHPFHHYNLMILFCQKKYTELAQIADEYWTGDLRIWQTNIIFSSYLFLNEPNKAKKVITYEKEHYEYKAPYYAYNGLLDTWYFVFVLQLCVFGIM